MSEDVLLVKEADGVVTLKLNRSEVMNSLNFQLLFALRDAVEGVRFRRDVRVIIITTQYGNLPLMQLVSVTGIAGITFLICWFGSLGNWAWEANFNWATVKRGALIYAGAFSLVMLGGGARLAFAPSDVKAVRMATMGTPAIYTAEAEELAYQLLFDPKISTKEREQVLQIFREEQVWFLESAQREARAGAKIVAWNETGAHVLDTDEEAFLERASAVARQEGIYLMMGVGPAHPGEFPAGDNKTVHVTPSGEV